MPPAKRDRDRSKIKDKVTKACERCRTLKVRCSGTQPCSRCERRKDACRYAEEDKRVSVSERYLRELQSQSRQSLATPSSRGGESHSSERDDESARDQMRFSHSGSLPPQSASPGMPHIEISTEPRHPPHHHHHQPSGPGTGGSGLGAVGGTGNLLSRSEPPQPQRNQRRQGNENANDNDTASGDFEPGFRQNPLADNDYTFAAAAGRYWYMGPTSSWSFCRRVLALLGKRIPEAAPDPWHRPDKGAYPLQWTPLRPDEDPDVSNLPPLDYALLLLQTAKFYLGDLFALIDQEDFVRNVHELYDNPAAKAQSSRTWYALFLLVLAFGKAFPVRNKGRGPPGSQYALRAMAMLPDMTGLHSDPVQSIQTLALAALYFQSVDMRLAAYFHISHALRICIIEGMHRYMPEEVVDINYSRSCNMAFWVIYVLEREFSALIGAPSSLRDEDITAKAPSQMIESMDAMNMTWHVRLSRLTARILTTVYGVGRQFDDSLISNTQDILRDLAQLSQDLTDLLKTHFQGSVTKASRMAQRLMLSYHHCVVLSTRPLVMCALQMHIEHSDMQLTEAIPLTPTVASLLYSCVDSAQTVLKMLRVLGEEDLLDAFLPFQLDAAYSSAFILYLIRLISPSLFQDDSWPDDIKYVLEKMISDGSLVAPLRKLELSQLEHIMSALSPSKDQSWGLTPGANYLPENSYEQSLSDDILGDPFWDIFVTNGVTGMPPQEMLDLADRLDDGFEPDGVHD